MLFCDGLFQSRSKKTPSPRKGRRFKYLLAGDADPGVPHSESESFVLCILPIDQDPKHFRPDLFFHCLAARIFLMPSVEFAVRPDRQQKHECQEQCTHNHKDRDFFPVRDRIKDSADKRSDRQNRKNTDPPQKRIPEVRISEIVSFDMKITAQQCFERIFISAVFHKQIRLPEQNIRKLPPLFARQSAESVIFYMRCERFLLRRISAKAFLSASLIAFTRRRASSLICSLFIVNYSVGRPSRRFMVFSTAFRMFS